MRMHVAHTSSLKAGESGGEHRNNNVTQPESPQGYSVLQNVIIAPLSLIMAAAIIGNLLVCIAVLTNSKLRKNSYFFNVSLAVADILMGSAVMPFAIVSDVSGTWPYGAAFCKFWVGMDLLSSCSSILHLCVIALDRYLLIRDPMCHGVWMTGIKTAGFISAVWIVAALMSFFPIFSEWQKPFNFDIHEVGTDICNYEVTVEFVVGFNTVSFGIPCIIMVVIYSKMLVYARYHANEIKRTTLPTPGHQSMSKKRQIVRRDRKALWTLGTIMGAFLACWLPIFITVSYYAICPECVPPLVFRVLAWLGYFNSCLNPIIYSVFNKEFRSAFHDHLCPCRAQNRHIRVGTDTTRTLPTTAGTMVTHAATAETETSFSLTSSGPLFISSMMFHKQGYPSWASSSTHTLPATETVFSLGSSAPNNKVTRVVPAVQHTMPATETAFSLGSSAP
ncbi:dopamine receptor 1-like [Littorina saxatilis]|uniref:G-protein coupled receptors family 1 profile domain-containing protein n=1 Tax=Littorina saxatilis TaxID=31220 RepID=A0AAN9B0Y4_9CAEN